MCRTNRTGIDIIKTFEGFSPIEYRCPGGYKTIGYGHRILETEKFEQISKEEAEVILYNDLDKIEKSIPKYIQPNLTQNQFSSLVSFTFNLGLGALQRSTLRQKINYGASNDEISAEFLRWVYAGGKKYPGLVRRREIEAELYGA